MTGGSGATGATLAVAFKSTLLSQGTLLFLIFVLLAIAWVTCRELLLARDRTRLVARLAAIRASQPAEPAARRVLRIGLGVLWIFDGLLQAQPAMPGGLPSGVIGPAAVGSPGWVRHLASWAATAWSAHPVQAAAGCVWIQLGIGVWLVSSASPRSSRAGGLVSLGWSLVVWVFGEAFGGMLAAGQTWLTGAPGAALFYCAASVLLVVPGRSWHDVRLGRGVLQASGLLLLAFAVLQAWPGRGFWQGGLHRPAGSLAAEIGGMAATRQPAALADLVRGFASLVASHGFAVNAGAVVVLAAVGCCLLTGRAAIAGPAAIATVVLCLADWVFIQDLGFLGGLGTDPNSMVPQALILTGGLVAMITAPAAASAPGYAVSHAPPEDAATEAAASEPGTTDPKLTGARSADPRSACPISASPISAGTARADTARAGLVAAPARASAHAVQLPGRALRSAGFALGTASTSAVLTLWAAAIVLLGAVPIALAMLLRSA